MLFKSFILGGAALVSASSAATSSMSKLAADLDSTATPLTKVVALLKEMKAQNEKEEKEDQEIFDKLACWCHTNREDKTAAVSAAQEKIAALEASIKELTAKKASLAEEIANLKKDIAENEASLEAATAQRNKEADEFHTVETDSITALGQLKGAITVLKKHQDSFLQESTLNDLSTVLKHIAYKFPNLISEEEKSNALNLIQSRPYANQSSEIFGILEAMQEQMTKDLSDAQASEAKAVADFTELREAKREEIAAGRLQLENKEQEHADTCLKLSEDKEDLEDTTNTLEADQAFLIDLEKRCKANADEMASRTKTRQMEIVAMNETIDIVTGDDARDTANKTLKVTFLQTKIASAHEKIMRQLVSKRLMKAAVKAGSPELSMLASSVQLDAFTKVKKAIEDMVAQLKIQQADEVTHKDFCNAEFHTNEGQTTTANRKMDDLKAQEDDLEASIAAFEAEIKQLKAEIAEMEVQLQSASEDRKSESLTFQQAVNDQREMQQILKKAVARMEKFYNAAKEDVSLAQESGKQGPPPGLSEGGYKRSAGAGGVVGMLQEIITDSKTAENELLKDEQDATAAYEEFVGNSNAGIADRQRATVAATENKASADKELVQTKEDISATLTELEKLAEYNKQLHKTCDFVVKNFEVRQTARSEEIEALQQAKQILSGAQ